MVKLIKAVKSAHDHKIIRDRDSYKNTAPNKRYTSAVWNESYFPFDPSDTTELKQYIKQKWGPGRYRVYKYGGRPPIEDHYNGWIE